MRQDGSTGVPTLRRALSDALDFAIFSESRAVCMIEADDGSRENAVFEDNGDEGEVWCVPTLASDRSGTMLRPLTRDQVRRVERVQDAAMGRQPPAAIGRANTSDGVRGRQRHTVAVVSHIPG